MLIESPCDRVTGMCPCPLTPRLNSQFRAKPPPNPMDIACPWSSTWLTVFLIRFRKRPRQLAACDKGGFR